MVKFKKALGYGNIILAIATLIISTAVLFLPAIVCAILKLFPNQQWQIWCTHCIDNIAYFWISANCLFIRKTKTTRFQVEGLQDHLRKDDWYLVVANHQTWVDIVALQYVFNDKIPMLKFFIKNQLKWIPLFGFIWWSMGCPFMKRYSKEYLTRKPHKKGKDIHATLKAMRLFQHMPTSIINFIEGTRFSPNKKYLQESPYSRLLKPKAGGIGFVITAMNKKITSILDVTIVYSDHKNSLWDFLRKRIREVVVHVRQIPIPLEFMQSNWVHNEEIQKKFRQWLNQCWHEKDKLIEQLRLRYAQKEELMYE